MKGLLPVFLLVLAHHTAHAADLGSEIAAWGPLATGTTPVDHGLWFTDALALGTSGDRLDDMFVVRRRPGVDAQAIAGFAFDGTGPGQYFGDNGAQADSSVLADNNPGGPAYWPTRRSAQDPRSESFFSERWGRGYIRGGTDPLADKPGSSFASLGAALCLQIPLSFQAEIGHSSSRGLLASGEVSLSILRVRIDRDKIEDTFRIGTGPRVLGTTGPLAWGILADYADSEMNYQGAPYDAQGLLASAFAMWRPYNHLLFAAELQFSSSALDRANPTTGPRPVLEGSCAIGIIF